MRSYRVLLLMTLVMTPLAAHAADLKVSYLVDAEALNAAIAGTPLTFSLFTDASCAGTPAATQVMNAETTQLLEQLKLMTPKGAIKPPKTARMEHVMAGVPVAPLLYLTVSGTGVTPVGAACQVQSAAVNGSEAVLPLPPPPLVCPPDSVQTGPGASCVDINETSVWDIPSGNTTLIQKVKDGMATLADLTGGGATQVGVTLGPPTYTCSPNYPGTFPSDGHYTAPLYAVSVPDVKPSACLTAYQAAVACQLSGKRLLTSAEWLAAAAGTVDTNTDNGTTDCNTNAPGAGVNAPVNTGSRSKCGSTSGMFDAIGNVHEWTVDRTTDILTGVTSAQAWYRGGDWENGTNASVSLATQRGPSFPDRFIGFRCGR